MRFVLTSKLRYNYLGSECIVYKTETAETLLLEQRVANILQAIPNDPITYGQLETGVASGIDSPPDNLSMDEVLDHLVTAGLVKKLA